MRRSILLLVAIAGALASFPADAEARRPRSRSVAPAAAPRPPRPPSRPDAPEAPQPAEAPEPLDAPAAPEPPQPPGFGFDAPPVPFGAQTFSFSFGRGRLGVGASSMTEDLRRFFGASANAGILVQSVQPDTPAQRAGVAVGDVIVRVDGDTIDQVGDVAGALSDRGPGDKIEIEVVRAKKTRRLVTELRDDDGAMQFQNLPPGAMHFFGDSDDGLQQQLESLTERLERLERRLDRGSDRRRPATPKRPPKPPARPSSDHT